jgi:hypothetical protein
MEGYAVSKKLTLQEKIDRAKPGDIIWHVVEDRKPLMLMEKPTVTREVLSEHALHLVDRIDGECGLSKLQRMGIFHLLTEKGDLEDIYFDVGVEVIDD